MCDVPCVQILNPHNNPGAIKSIPHIALCFFQIHIPVSILFNMARCIEVAPDEQAQAVSGCSTRMSVLTFGH